jgi:hypothetical protein
MILDQKQLNQQIASSLNQLILRVSGPLGYQTNHFFLPHHMILDQKQLNQQVASSLNQ